MSIFNQYFGKTQGAVEDYTISSDKTVKELGKVYVRKTLKNLQVRFTILLPPDGKNAEGWQTGVALDASSSMTTSYGRELKGQLPDKIYKKYENKGWINYEEEDGQYFRIFDKVVVEEALKKGYFKYTDNVVEPIARKFIAYLASELDVDGGTTVIYWACGQGNEYEVLGDVRSEDCENLVIRGPQKARFGVGTKLKPAMEYYCNRFATAERGMYIFITDGRIDDLEAVKQYTVKIAKEMAANKRKLVKCVLIGVGKAVDEQQMIILDDLDTGTEIDIWDHKLANNMRDLIEIFAELVDENQIVATMADIFDSEGQLVKRFTDGLPAKVTIDLPVTSQWFELEVDGRRIRQTVLLD